MKHIALYLMLLIAIPATAQSGLFGSHPHHPSPPEHHHGSLMHYEPHVHAPSVQYYGMNPKDFEKAIQLISDETFDSKRLTVAKRIITDNKMSVKQIASICELFTFEANRLEFAKYAYRFCVDPNRYFLLDEVFTYSSSKEELFDYIHRH